MGTDTDFELTVKGMVQAHGVGAVDEAKLMLDRMTCRGDTGGIEFWDQVYAALRQRELVTVKSGRS